MGASDDLMLGYAELCTAREGYEEADAFADGSIGESFASRRVRAMLLKQGVEIIEDFNYAEVPIRTISTRLRPIVPSPVRIDAEGAAQEPETQVSAAFAALWRRNQLDAELKNLVELASRHGDAYLFVWPVTEMTSPDAMDDDELDGIEGPEPAPTEKIVSVDILVNDARSVRVIYSVENPLQKAFAIKSWTLGAGDKRQIRATLYYADHVEKWITKPGMIGKLADDWIRLPEEPEDIPNLTGVVPFFHLRNHRPYGRPEHKNAYGPQRLINKLVATLAAVLEFLGFPQRYYLVDPKVSDPLENLNDPDYPFDDGDDPEDPANQSPLKADPAAVWRLYARQTGQYEAANPDVFLRPFDRAVQAMSELCGIPKHHFGAGTGDTPSGAALRTLEAPTVEIVKDREEAYGPVLEDAFELALHLLGFEGYQVPMRWQPAMTITDVEGWQVVQAKIEAGVSAEQALIEAGYTEDQVKSWMDSTEGADIMRRVAMLNNIATAAQALGTAVGLGVFSEAQVQALIDHFVGAIVAPEPAPTGG